ncbi:MAG: hypothetical protein AB7S75_22215 [Desulfococcaceae bacterium]
MAGDIEPLKVLKARVYRICKANVLIRAASYGNKKFFYGINYITIEEMANLPNPYIAFICSSLDKTIILPAKLLFDNLYRISHDRNGEYKITIDSDLKIVLKGKGIRLDCSEYINNWDILSSPIIQNIIPETVEDNLHSIIQGRLLEIGNYRGYYTFCPDKSKKFNNKILAEVSSLEICPDMQFSDYDLLRKIDVLWFKEKGSNLIPEKAFEVELSTGIWSGFGRMMTLADYENVKFYVISNDSKKFNKVINTFPAYKNRFTFITTELIGDLYSAEKNIKELRYYIGI